MIPNTFLSKSRLTFGFLIQSMSKLLLNNIIQKVALYTMKQKRIIEIEHYIAEKETVSLIELSEVFKVSINTIRRDINYLESNGVLKKVYGGVTSLQGKQLTPFDYRTTKHQDIKERISKLAASLIETDDLIYIDSGTTAANILKYINTDIKITVLTNSLDIIYQATQLQNVDLIILGNRYNHKTRSFVTAPFNRITLDFNITKAFMGATGVSIDAGLTISDFNELDIKKMASEKTQRLYLLADHTKFDKSSLVTYTPLNNVHTILTDQPLSKAYLQFNKINNIHTSLA